SPEPVPVGRALVAREGARERAAQEHRRGAGGVQRRGGALGQRRRRTQALRGRSPRGAPAPGCRQALMPAKKKVTRRKKASKESRGLTAKELLEEPPPAAVKKLADAIVEDGGTLVGLYRDPLGGHWQIIAGLPLSKVEPTPYQRDL